MRTGLAGALFIIVATRVMAADVVVKVTGVRSDRGTIAVAICDKETFPGKNCLYKATAPAQPGEVSVRVAGVPAGTWAAAVYHDELNKKKLEFTLFGTPKQGFGFSRDAPLRFGPPRFADAAFKLGDADGSVTVPLHYPQP